MRSIKYIVFDFDGTIADTIEPAFNIFNSIAAEYNYQPITKEDREEIRMGKPQELLKKYKISEFHLLLILLRVRKEMGKHIQELKPVKGIRESLHEIKETGFRLGILTSNAKSNVELFLRNSELKDITDFIYSGKSLFGKDRVMKRLFNSENITSGEIIYVGDEIRDIEASRKAGVKVIAVSWGLSSRKLLESAEPDQIADSPADLLQCIHRIVKQAEAPVHEADC